MRNWLVAFLFIPAMLAVAADKPNPPIDPAVVEILGGKTAVDVLQNAETVQGSLQPAESYHEDDVSKYGTRLGPIELSAKQREQLTTLLLSRTSYLIGVGKGCEPDYGVRVTFRKGERTVDVLFCFGCEQLQTYVNGKSTSGGLFDPSTKDFLNVVQQIFPDDEAIQSLNK